MHHGGGVDATAWLVAYLRELVEQFTIASYQAGQVARSTSG